MNERKNRKKKIQFFFNYAETKKERRKPERKGRERRREPE